MDFNRKLAGMMLLLAERRKVTRTELNKLVFFADVVHYLRHGAWISDDCCYFKKQFGPVHRDADQVRNALVAWEFLDETSFATSLYYQYNYQTREDKVDLDKVKKTDGFKGSEIEAIADVGRCLSRFNATELSNRSHLFEPWKGAAPQEELQMDRVRNDIGLHEWLGKAGISLPAQ